MAEKVQIVASLSLPSHEKVNPTLTASNFRIRTRFDKPFAPPQSGQRDRPTTCEREVSRARIEERLSQLRSPLDITHLQSASRSD